MVTRVGKQKEFSEALKELVELEYDAHEAYGAAINRLSDAKFKEQLTKFSKVHEKHIKEITKLLKSKNQTPPEGPSTKQWLTKGKVVIANLMGDKAILSAICSNEEDVSEAYKNMCAHSEKWPESEDLLLKAQEDVRRHKEWLGKQV